MTGPRGAPDRDERAGFKKGAPGRSGDRDQREVGDRSRRARGPGGRLATKVSIITLDLPQERFGSSEPRTFLGPSIRTHWRNRDHS